MNVALIFAGGVGARMQANVPKQFLEVNDIPILVRTIQIFQANKNIDKVYVVMLKEYIDYTKYLVNKYKLNKVVDVVSGGDTGQDSIYRGLCRISEDCPVDTTVLIHDGVRPILPSEVIDKNIDSVKKYGSAITCKKCTETIIMKGLEDDVVDMTDRSISLMACAPQSFILGDILEAHKAVRKINPNYEGVIDSCTLMRIFKMKLHIVMGNNDNIKVTTKDDYFIANAILTRGDKPIELENYGELLKFRGEL